MADEQAQEATQPQEGSQVTQANVSEDAKTPSEGRGEPDYQVAMHQERTKRQQMEASLSDPDFIYQQAVKLGLAEQPAAQPAPTPQPQQQMTNAQQEAMIAAKIDYDLTVREHPELASDPKMARMFRGLAQQGMRWSDAAAEIRETLGTATTAAKAEGAKAKETEVSEKERAQTATTSATTTSDAAEIEDLRTKSRSLNRKVQEEAMVQLLQRGL